MKNTADRLNEHIDYLEDRLENLENPDDIEALDIEIRTDLEQKVKEIILTTTTGGPHIQIKLYKETVEGYWSRTERFRSVDFMSDEAEQGFLKLKNYWEQMAEARGFEV